MTKWVLGFYANDKDPTEILKQLSLKKLRRSAVIHKAPDGKVTFRNNHNPLGLATFLCGGTLLLIGILTGLSLVQLAILMLFGLLILTMSDYWLNSGVDKSLLMHYGRWVLEEETLAIVQTSDGDTHYVVEALSGIREEQPAIFIFRSSSASAPKLRLEQPPREPLLAERLKHHAERLAAGHRVSGAVDQPQPLLSLLAESEQILTQVRQELAEAVRLKQVVTPAAEWLLDNAYIVQGHIAEIRRHLPRRYYQDLPILTGDSQEINLRIYSLAREFITHTDARVSQANIVDFLQSYQKISSLSIGELWIYPLMLRLVLIADLHHRAIQVNRRQHERERADFWANRLLNAARRDPDHLLHILAELAREHPTLPPHFALRLIGHLYDEEVALSPVQRWLERKLDAPLQDIIRQEQSRQAADQVSISNAIGSLRQLAQLDWKKIFESLSQVETILREDPAGVYSRMDFLSRDLCRHTVEEIARHSKASEQEVARRAVELARQAQFHEDERKRHVGFYLTDPGRQILESHFHCRVAPSLRMLRWVRRHPTAVYLGSIGIFTMLILTPSLALVARNAPRPGSLFVWLSLLALFPASEVAIQLVNYLASRWLPPHILPKMSFEDGIPDEFRTLVVVPMMLLTKDSIREEVAKLEVRYLANPDTNLDFALLSDFSDAPQAEMPEDKDLLQVAVQGIEELNGRHGKRRFFLFHRQRRWCQTEGCWMGWERKRGKLEELNCYLNGEAGLERGDFLRVGEAAGLQNIRYVITLDADTQLPHGTARRMVETIAHPLNQPRVDPDRRVVTSGYTIIQPRVSITLPSATASHFTRIFTDATGTDPYTQAVSDVYQDLFGEGIYHGKAIYDVRSFHRLLTRRFPQELLLSHDLIEGEYVRVGLATDIELFEQFPVNYQTYSHRQHRWIRGDWQIAAWILPHVPTATGGREPNPLSFISRWKIFDNLRRSLVPVASVLLLMASWLFLPAIAFYWSLLVALVFLVPALLHLPSRLVELWRGNPSGWYEQARDLARALISASLMLHQAWMSIDAIGRVWYRCLFSRRHLLQWESAQVAHWRIARRLNQFVLQILILWVITAAMTLTLAHRNFSFWSAALPFLLFWLISPIVADWMNLPKRLRKAPSLAQRDRQYLRQVARQTWRFFDDFVGPERNWLPPDNSQEALRIEVAMRTSPTNIGLWLLSLLAARDFGYLTTDKLIERALATMDTLDKLERHQGHLLNWYDIKTLEPLRPGYVSTVDSGNLLASLWVLEQGCRELASKPLLGPDVVQGLADTLAILHSALVQDGIATRESERLLLDLTRILEHSPNGMPELIQQIRQTALRAQGLIQALQLDPSSHRESVYWAKQLQEQATAWMKFIECYLPWVEELADLPETLHRSLGEDWLKSRRQALFHVPSLEALAGGELTSLSLLLEGRAQPTEISEPFKVWLKGLVEKFARARRQAGETLDQTEILIRRLRHLGEGINLRFLYDPQRKVFSIGYNVGTGLRDSSYYDLLASEARLTSLVAIARDDVPVDHWLALGRPFVSSNGRRVLLSWSGTMFEYLMPLLYNRAFENSLLEQACRESVNLQIEYGRKRGIPWGISESAFSALDSNQTYQYRAFGVPALGLKRGLEEDLVVAPYATTLALLVDPVAAVSNLKRLSRAGLQGRKGFYEALDYTRERRPEGERGVIIYAYMAHHQGMSLLAIDNVLNDGVMQNRFHSDLRVRASEPLLFERIPPTPSMFLSPSPERPTPRLISSAPAPGSSRVNTQDTPTPRAHLLGNGSYTLMITNAGGGYSRWRDFDISRWRADTTRDCWGSFCYVRDVESGNTWSTTYHPVDRPERRYSATFSADRVEFRRRDAGIETVTEVIVSPEDDAEIRRITLTNRSSRTRHLELTSYSELALAPHNADRAHPAFSKLFVQTEALVERGALLAWRRARSPEDPGVWTAHVIAPATASGVAFQFETDRVRFLGPGRGPENPAGMEGALSKSTGAVLDPIFSLRRRVAIKPGQRERLSFVTVAAETRERALALAEKYRELQATNRAFELAWTHAQLEFRYLGIQVDEAQRFQQLASHMLYPNSQLRPPPERLRRNALGQSRLWAYGISGDLPILAVTVDESTDLSLVREVLLAHTYWRVRGLKADLVILNKEAASYEQPLHNQLTRMIQAHSLHTGMDRPGGVFLRLVEQIPEEDLTLLLASARALLVSARGSLAQQMSRAAEAAELPRRLRFDTQIAEEPSPPLPFMELPYFNGLGGFTPDGREYAIYLGPGDQTPAPWVNVIANPQFGTLVSESGQGMAWYGNSQANRLTPWLNDPVSAASSDAIYLRDEDLGVFWTLSALPIRELDAYRARHGQGYTLFEHNSHALEQELVTFVPMDNEGGASLRVQRVRLRNRSSRRRRLTVTAYAEWTLGTDREETQLHIMTNWDAQSRSLLARNAYHPDFSRRIAFASSTPGASSFTADRSEFLGRNGSLARPAALRRQSLSNRTGVGLDPCAAVQVSIELDPDKTTEIVFLLGQGANIQEVRSLVQRYQDPVAVEESLATTRDWWDRLLGTLQVQTPDLAVDFLLNRWLLYQTLSCRIWGRSALYQSGGAFGFRDQLQDVIALFHVAPEIAREHILRTAGHQFVEGDVQHWWHPPSGAGIRSRCSDDLLWLPYVTVQYVRATGDLGILDARVPFLDGHVLEPNEHEVYLVPTPSLEDGSLFEHCRRALEKGMSAGPHGLPLMGSGDWNDGMNRVGTAGQGESVWLAWFLIDVLKSFAELCELRGETSRAATYRDHLQKLSGAVEANGWDGEWYRRAYFDDGTPLGSKDNLEAEIDSLPQSWAVISGAANPARAKQALAAVERRLVREEEKLILLFAPPFDRSLPHPGYIMGYPPGVRENGGQYTHGALWTALAFARQGNGDRAVELLRMLNPVEHTHTPTEVARYRGEPYVIAADVYALPGQVGRCGWTWYTGSSGWMYRVWVEEVLGFKLRGDSLVLDPVIPTNWPGYTLRYRYRSSWYDITVENPDKFGRGIAWIELDDQRLPEAKIPLRDDGAQHRVRLRLGISEELPSVDIGSDLYPGVHA